MEYYIPSDSAVSIKCKPTKHRVILNPFGLRIHIDKYNSSPMTNIYSIYYRSIHFFIPQNLAELSLFNSSSMTICVLSPLFVYLKLP